MDDKKQSCSIDAQPNVKHKWSPYISSQQVNDLEGVLDNGDCHQLLAIVAAMHHEGVGEALHHRTLHSNGNTMIL